MKLAILQNSDVMEKNGFQIRTQRPKIIQKQVVLFQDKKKLILLTCVTVSLSGFDYLLTPTFDLDYYGSITIAQLEGGSKYTFWNSMSTSGPNVAPPNKNAQPNFAFDIPSKCAF